jgi:dual specificity tyrosine-phosphorylation-regulated kinase 2/3/4
LALKIIRNKKKFHD